MTVGIYLLRMKFLTQSKVDIKHMEKSKKISIGFAILIFAFSISSLMASPEEVINIKGEISKFKSAKSPEQKLEAVGKLRRGARGDSETGRMIANEVRKEKNTHLKSRLVEAMSDFRQKETQDVAIESLKDGSREVRFSAAYTLGYIAEPSAASELIRVFSDEGESKGVRFQAANALAMRSNDPGWPKEEIITVFLKAIESSDPDIRAQGITSLTFVAPDDKRTSDAVRRLLRDENEFVRKTAEGRAEFLGIK